MAWVAPIVGAGIEVGREMIGYAGEPFEGSDAAEAKARAAAAADEANMQKLNRYTRPVDEGAFAPLFGNAAAGSEVYGQRNIGTGVASQEAAQRQMENARAGVTNVSTAGLANAAQLQGQSATMLGREYAGNADPSAAQMQLQAGTDAALRAQLAAARSGGNPAAAYQAQLMGAQTLQTAANQAAVLRAQERQAARGDLLQAQAASTSAQDRLIGTRIGQQTAAAGIAGQQAAIGQSLAGLGQQQLGRSDTLREQDRQAKIGLDAAKSQEFAGARNYTLGLGSQGIQQQQVNLAAGDQADRRQGVSDAKTAAAIQGGAQLYQQYSDSEKQAEREAEAERLKPAEGTYDPWAMSDTRSKREIKALKAENAMLRGAPQGDADVREYLGTIEDTDEDAAAENAFLARYDYGPERPAYDAQQTSMGLYDPWGPGAPPAQPVQPEAYASAFAPLAGPWATSDERAKEVHQVYDRAQPIAFEYRDGYGPPGRREGITAQSLERSPLGRSMVRRDPETGMRQVDTPQLTMANAAEIAMLRDEVRALKGRR